MFGMGAGGGTFVPASGRWPSNLILEHPAGCEKLGVARVKSSDRSGHEGKESARSVVFDRPTAMHSPVRHGDADGMETVDSWACAPECPVKDLVDGCRDQRCAAGESTGTQHGKFVGWAQQKDGSVRGIGYGQETGSAARFFKQVQACE